MQYDLNRVSMWPIECKGTIWRGPLKQIIITPIIKKASLDPNELKQTTDLSPIFPKYGKMRKVSTLLT